MRGWGGSVKVAFKLCGMKLWDGFSQGVAGAVKFGKKCYTS